VTPAQRAGTAEQLCQRAGKLDARLGVLVSVPNFIRGQWSSIREKIEQLSGHPC
jgi:hypothetical protein